MSDLPQDRLEVRKAPERKERKPIGSLVGRIARQKVRVSCEPIGAKTITDLKSAASSLHKNDVKGAEQLIEEALHVDANRIEVDQIVKALAKSLGVSKQSVEDLRRNVEKRVFSLVRPTEGTAADLGKAERQKKHAELFERVKHIATKPSLLDEMADVVARLGVVGERRAIDATYLTVSSRLCSTHAISLLRRGAAASGKNHVAEAVFKLVPPESVVPAVGGSPRALAYVGGVEEVDALKHKVIYIPEAAAIADKHGVESEFTTMLRVLISERRLVYQTVRTQKDQPPVTVTVTKNGPIAVVITSARANIEEEMMTRLMVVDADESGEQTRAIVANALTDRHRAVTTDEVERWVDFQRWLEFGSPYEVAIPFLDAIFKAHGDGADLPLRYRRDIANFLTAINASAIIHSAQRERDAKGRIVADIRDYMRPRMLRSIATWGASTA
jgi:hypothetical protein